MKKAIRTLLAALLVLPVLTAVLLPAFAEEETEDPTIGYSGEIDPKTGKPVTDDREIDTEITATRIEVISGVYYDRDTSMYYYTVGSSEVGISIPAGSVTVDSSKVSLDVPSGMNARLFRDGDEDSTQDLKDIRKRGAYRVFFDSTGEEGITELDFTIVGEITGALTEFAAPNGFNITKATLNGQDVAHTTGRVEMTEDGKYDVEYVCVRTGIRHRLQVELDHVPPTLKLEAVKDGEAVGPVDLSDLEPGVNLVITLNNKKIDTTKELTRSGKYKLVLTDPAGNITVYEFSVHVYFNASGVMFLLIFAAVLLLAGAYMYWSRKRLRIR